VASRWKRVEDLIGSGYLPFQKQTSYDLRYLVGNLSKQNYNVDSSRKPDKARKGKTCPIQ